MGRLIPGNFGEADSRFDPEVGAELIEQARTAYGSLVAALTQWYETCVKIDGYLYGSGQLSGIDNPPTPEVAELIAIQQALPGADEVGSMLATAEQNFPKS